MDLYPLAQEQLYWHHVWNTRQRIPTTHQLLPVVCRPWRNLQTSCAACASLPGCPNARRSTTQTWFLPLRFPIDAIPLLLVGRTCNGQKNKHTNEPLRQHIKTDIPQPRPQPRPLSSPPLSLTYPVITLKSSAFMQFKAS